MADRLHGYTTQTTLTFVCQSVEIYEFECNCERNLIECVHN